MLIRTKIESERVMRSASNATFYIFKVEQYTNECVHRMKTKPNIIH